MCAVCEKVNVRRDNTPCPKCGRHVCKYCRRFDRDGYCRECVPALPDGREGNGGPRPNSGPRKGWKAHPFRLKSGNVISAKPIDPEPEKGQKCESCTKFKAAVKCAACAKMICGFCARRLNGQCTECHAASEVR